jgi:hypothetical protein
MVLDGDGLGGDDTDGILDFIKDLPDINPVSAAAGGMFKSRSAINLSTLGALRCARGAVPRTAPALPGDQQRCAAHPGMHCTWERSLLCCGGHLKAKPQLRCKSSPSSASAGSRAVSELALAPCQGTTAR